jgi:hypothetical protein
MILRMRFSWRLGFLMILVVVAVAMVWMRIASLRYAHTSATQPIIDLGATMPLNQPGGGVAPADAYEVYSVLYKAPMHEPLAFSEDSATDIPQVNGNCLRPAAPQEHEMTDAFTAANQQSHRWERKFSIAQGYRLLPHGELALVQTCLATHGRDVARCESYQQLRYVRFLGVPGFDHAHTRALVSVIKNCGRMCGSGGIFAVENVGGTWHRSATTDFTRDCSWMY